MATKALVMETKSKAIATRVCATAAHGIAQPAFVQLPVQHMVTRISPHTMAKISIFKVPAAMFYRKVPSETMDLL